MTTHRSASIVNVSPLPEIARIFFGRTREIRAPIVVTQFALNHSHLCQPLMCTTTRMDKTACSEGIDGFAIHVAIFIWAEEFTARFLSTEPKEPVLGC